MVVGKSTVVNTSLVSNVHVVNLKMAPSLPNRGYGSECTPVSFFQYPISSLVKRVKKTICIYNTDSPVVF